MFKIQHYSRESELQLLKKKKNSREYVSEIGWQIPEDLSRILNKTCRQKVIKAQHLQ